MPHVALVAAIFAFTVLGFAGVIALSLRSRESEQDPGELPLPA